MQIFGGLELHPSQLAFVVLAVVALVLIFAYFTIGLGKWGSLGFIVTVFFLGATAAISSQHMENLG